MHSQVRFDGFERAEYALPSMSEIVATPPNGRTMVSSFSGAGGSCLGFKLAGFDVPYAIEFIEAAADTYQANFPDTFVDRRDVRTVKPDEILSRLGLKPGELDVFEGSPPCASYSSAGKRERGWGEEKFYSGIKQTTDDLFFEWTRLLNGLRPRAFVAENVPGLIMGNAIEEYAHKITSELGALGYRVDARVLNAAAYGVPQERERLIFLGYRADLEIQPLLPAPTSIEPVTLRDALATVKLEDPAHLIESSMEPYAVGRAWWRIVRERARLESNETQSLRAENRELRGLIRALLERGLTKELQERGQHTLDEPPIPQDKLYFLLTVPKLDAPCPTVSATAAQVGAASVTHPLEPRKFTPAELKAISSFPPDFVLTGTRQQQCERLGRAVPPLLMKAVAETVARDLSSIEVPSAAEDAPDALFTPDSPEAA